MISLGPEKIDALWDTNIILYAVRGEEKYLRLLQTIGCFGISVVTQMELFINVQSGAERDALFSFLNRALIVALEANVAMEAAGSLCRRGQKNLRSHLLADTVIACTALSLGVPLVTNNPKDFAGFEGLKLITP